MSEPKRCEFTWEQVEYLKRRLTKDQRAAFARMANPTLGDVAGTAQDVTTNRLCLEILDEA